MKKFRLSEVLEIVVLGAGVVLLVHFSCGNDADVEAERASKVFSAARLQPAAADVSAGGESRRRVVEEALADLLGGIATGRVSEARRSEIQNGLSALLERSGWGKPQNRASAAGIVVQQMFDQAKLQTVSSELGFRQRQAIQAMAKELTRQLLLLAVGASAGADGIVAALPAGHERLSWSKLGDFSYQEGGPLPSEVLALTGTRVGIPGFMLTLGEADKAREFILVESLWGCCFGSVPALNQTLLVSMKADQVADYTAAPIVVVGTLEVGEVREGGFVTSLYRLRDASVSSVGTQPEP